MESQKYNFETDYFTECPACGSVPKDDPRCVEYLQDGKVLYERYKLYGKHCEQLRDISSYKLGKLMKYIIDNHLNKCTSFIQLIASLFPLTTENSSLMSKPNQLIPMKGKPVKINRQRTVLLDKNQNITEDAVQLIKQFGRFGNRISYLELEIDRSDRPDRREFVVDYISWYKQEIFDTIEATQKDVQGNNSANPAERWSKLVRFIYDFENDDLRKPEYQYGVYFWILNCYRNLNTLFYNEIIVTIKSLFVSLLCLKLHQLDPTGETNHDKQDLEPPTQPCRVFKYIDSAIPVKTTGVNYRNGKGAFCLEQTVYEVANVVLSLRDQLGIVGNKLIISQFADKTNDAQHQFDKFANFVDSQRGKGLTASEKSSVSVAATRSNFLRLLLAVLQDSSTDFDEFLESMIEDPPIGVIQDRINSLLGEDILEMVDGTDIKLFYKKQTSSFAVVKILERYHAKLDLASKHIVKLQGYSKKWRMIISYSRVCSITANMDVLLGKQELLCELQQYLQQCYIDRVDRYLLNIQLDRIAHKLRDLPEQLLKTKQAILNIYNVDTTRAQKIREYYEMADNPFPESYKTELLAIGLPSFIIKDILQGGSEAKEILWEKLGLYYMEDFDEGDIPSMKMRVKHNELLNSLPYKQHLIDINQLLKKLEMLYCLKEKTLPFVNSLIEKLQY